MQYCVCAQFRRIDLGQLSAWSIAEGDGGAVLGEGLLGDGLLD